MRRSRRDATRSAVVLGIAVVLVWAAPMTEPATAAPERQRPARLGGALADLVDAFDAFDRAAGSLHPGADLPAVMPGVIAARARLLETALRLEEVVSSGQGFGAQAAVQTPCLDLVGADSRYTVDCPLLVDVGGNDVYGNNAGGVNGGAAALVDLGGNDTYGGTRSLGVNGGAVAGAGFLFDASGDDSYSAGSNGTNGGAYFFGAGFLLDGGGNDRYTATQCGTNGGACSLGFGHLVDLGSGSDSYTGTRFGVNGGADAGAGLLLDAGGTDTYSDQEACSGSGIDRTLAPTGNVGAQLDSTNPSGSACLPRLPSPPPRPAFGSIAGTVTETRSGAGIIGARVDCGGGGTAVALVDGRYTIPASRVGTHRCTASAVGFQSKSLDVTVTEGATTTASFKLRRT